MDKPVQVRPTRLLETIRLHQIVVHHCQKEIRKIFIIYCQVSKEEFYQDHWR